MHTVRDRCYQEQGQLHCTVGQEDVQLNSTRVRSEVGSGQVKGHSNTQMDPKDGWRERSKVRGQTGQNTQTIRHNASV